MDMRRCCIGVTVCIVSGIFLLLPVLYIAQVFRVTTFGERPRQAADASDAHLLLLAGSQHRCLVDRAEALKV